MRAAWWWIDRWRKSTAYTDMTAEAQGVYRNLLDELWLRNGALPHDERVLAKIGGDAEAWPRVCAIVLSKFILVGGALRNATHDAIMGESRRRAERQQRYRDKRRNVTGDVPHNVTQSPSPSPSPTTEVPKKETTDVVSAEDTAAEYITAFNSALNRQCSVTPGVRAKTKARLRTWPSWQIVAVPLLVTATSTHEFLRTLAPECLLRDGLHPRTTRAGYTSGATDHLERAYARADQTALDGRLTAIAEQLGVRAKLEALHVRMNGGQDG